MVGIKLQICDVYNLSYIQTIISTNFQKFVPKGSTYLHACSCRSKVRFKRFVYRVMHSESEVTLNLFYI